MSDSSDVKYEFTDKENAQLEELITNLKSFILPLLAFAVIQAGATLYSYFHMDTDFGPALYPFSALLVLVCCAFAALIHTSINDFRLIVDTEGSDIAHLLNALTRVKKSFILASALVLGVIILLTGALAQMVSAIINF